MLLKPSLQTMVTKLSLCSGVKIFFTPFIRKRQIIFSLDNLHNSYSTNKEEKRKKN